MGAICQISAAVVASGPFADDFNRSDRELVGDNGWIGTLIGNDTRPSLLIVGNRVTNSGAYRTAYRNLSTISQEFEIDVYVPTGGVASNSATVYYCTDRGISSSAGWVRFKRDGSLARRTANNDNTDTQIKPAGTYIAGTGHRLKVRRVGTDHKIWVDGELLYTGADAAPFGTETGLILYVDGGTAYFDNLNTASPRFTFADDFETAGATAAPYETFVYPGGSAVTWTKADGLISQTGGTSGFDDVLVVPMYSEIGYVEAVVASGNRCGLACRFSDAGFGGPAVWARDTGAGSWTLYNYNGAGGFHSTNGAGPVVPGDRVRLEATAAQVNFYVNGVLKASVSPPTTTASQNKFGLYSDRPNNAFFHSLGINTPAAAAPVVFTDTFNRAWDSTTINGETTSDGKAVWETHVGTPNINVIGNVAQKNADNDSSFIIPTGLSDVEVKATLLTPTLRAGLIVRAVDVSNYWQFHKDATFNTVQIRKIVAGNPTGTTVNVAAPVGASVELRVVMQGSTLNFYYDGVLVHSETSTVHQGATKHGIYAYSNNSQLDNFTVQSI